MTPPNLSLVLIMVCFWVTLWIVHRFLVIPVGAVLEERRSRVDGAEKEWAAKHEEYLSATRRLETEIEDAAREGAKVREDYRQRAQAARQQRLDSARTDAEKRLDEALTTLEAESDAARAELRAKAKELSALFAQRLLGREVQA